MMSTLTMVLAVTLATGSAPEKVSGEVEQRLNLSGEWEGTWQQSEVHPLSAAIRTIDGDRRIEAGSSFFATSLPLSEITDKRDGRFFTHGSLGIYQQRSDQILLCFRSEEKGYPSAFYGGSGQHLILLHRVRPRK